MACDPPCVKIIVDSGMGKIAAQFYSDVEVGMPLTAAAAKFYASGVEDIFQPLAQTLMADKGRLSDEQREALMAQVDKQCYRAKYFIAWGRATVEYREEKAEAWVKQIFEWSKEDQDFYTKLATPSSSGKKETVATNAT